MGMAMAGDEDELAGCCLRGSDIGPESNESTSQELSEVVECFRF